MRLVAYLVMGLFAVIVQAGLVPLVQIHGAVPDLPVALACAVGVLYGSEDGGLCGAAVGGIVDLWTGQDWGLGILLMGTAGVIAGQAPFLRSRQALGFWAVLSGGIGGFLVRTGGLVALALGGGHTDLASLLDGLPDAAYTAVLVPFIVVLLDGRARLGAARRRPAG
jgi:hypothetical protein